MLTDERVLPPAEVALADTVRRAMLMDSRSTHRLAGAAGLSSNAAYWFFKRRDKTVTLTNFVQICEALGLEIILRKKGDENGSGQD